MTQADGPGAGTTGDDLDYYVEPGPMTDLRRWHGAVFDRFPRQPGAICRGVQGLLVHEYWAASYGLDLTEERLQQVRTRPAAAMVDRIRSLDPAPLAEARPPERRMVGNCRHFATLTTALLRRNGIPARARCGFAGYFEPDKMVDHWVTEHYSAEHGRWVRADSQLDDLQRQALRVDFDPSDVPPGAFLTAGEAWRACRRGLDDPGRFGILDMWGLWFVGSNVIRDLAALNKMELLPWDVWGPMTFGRDPTGGEAELIDEIAGVVVRGDARAVRHLYGDDGLRVPATVFDARFGEPHRLEFDQQ